MTRTHWLCRPGFVGKLIEVRLFSGIISPIFIVSGVYSTVVLVAFAASVLQEE